MKLLLSEYKTSNIDEGESERLCDLFCIEQEAENVLIDITFHNNKKDEIVVTGTCSCCGKPVRLEDEETESFLRDWENFIRSEGYMPDKFLKRF